MTRRAILLKWILYCLCALALALLQGLVLVYVRVWGVHPFLLPAIAVIPATLERNEQALLYAVFFGLVCDLLSPVAGLPCFYALAFLLGAAAIVGAMKYTLGKNPYGYRGLGDVFVFIFFGLVSVLGGYYVAARELPPLIMLLPASAIGCFSVGVLNVNNIRDMKTDAVNRVTVAIKLGMKGARIYQTILVTLGWALILVFCAVYDFAPGHYIFIITLPLYIKHLQGVWTRSERALDPMLPMLVISTFFLSILAGAGFLIF